MNEYTDFTGLGYNRKYAMEYSMAMGYAWL